MKRSIMLLMTLVVCLATAACSTNPAAEQASTEPRPEAEYSESTAVAHSEKAETVEEAALQGIDLAGLWHLDE